MRNIFCSLAVSLLVFTATSITEAKVSGKIYSSEIKSNFESKKPFSGVAFTLAYFLKLYDVYLWTDAKRWSYDEKFALILDYNVSASGEDISERSVKEISRYHDISNRKEELENLFMEIFPDVSDGDVITGLYKPNEGASFFYNGEAIGDIKDEKVAKMFFDIWLGENNHYKSKSCKLRKVSGSECR